MHTLLHGDDTVKLHAHLVVLLDEARTAHIPVIRLSAKGLTVPELETSVGTQELFASQKIVVLEKIHGLPKGKNKDELIDWVASYTGMTHLILLEEKLLTPAQLKKFPTAKVIQFRLPQILFAWLETIGMVPATQAISQFHTVLLVQEVEICFVLLCRQIRQLIAFVADGTYDGPPFAKQKIVKQARTFTREKLLVLHKKLLSIDYRQKTSTASLSLPQEIDLWLTEL